MSGSVVVSPASGLNFVRDGPSTLTVTIRNKNIEAVAFKIQTSAQSSYYVRPNKGILEPKRSIDVSVTFHGSTQSPAADGREDRFAVLSMLITPDKENIALDDLWHVYPTQIRRRLFVSTYYTYGHERGKDSAMKKEKQERVRRIIANPSDTRSSRDTTDSRMHTAEQPPSLPVEPPNNDVTPSLIPMHNITSDSLRSLDSRTPAPPYEAVYNDDILNEPSSPAPHYSPPLVSVEPRRASVSGDGLSPSIRPLPPVPVRRSSYPPRSTSPNTEALITELVTVFDETFANIQRLKFVLDSIPSSLLDSRPYLRPYVARAQGRVSEARV
ncbi:PapD-like protein [Sistotremastrum niveocremeum HHB9708]|uniref:PapD-like protein n=1 Tax=Sistotremastrum niveocremeum HHB9708 TaxID=1314777 RepID=A0A164V114_9AGAM|nr:PapD-like protein [Sistotremastrum niveocremeum HHB9708]